jgi:hypothetical protein
MRSPIVWSVAAAALALAAASCKSDKSTGPVTVTSSQYSGAFADGAGGGQIVILIPAGSGTLTITGSLYTGAGIAPVVLGGTFISGSGVLAATGGTWTIAGTLAGGKIGGTYVNGSRNGIFTLENDVSNSVAVYCGSFIGAATGTWNLTVNGTSMSGVYAQTGGSPYGLSGNVVSSSPHLSITYAAGTASGDFTDAGHTAMSGSWSAGGPSGTWSGSEAACHS